jgi:predicted DNA-binding antitoxin AbrB/MazE fold protein
MITTITAVFEAGVLRPTLPLDLAEGASVELIMVNGKKAEQQPRRSAAAILAEIAALPTAGGDPRTSEDHDKILYGEQGAR